MTKKELFKEIHDIGVLPVVKIDDEDKAIPLAKALNKGGIRYIEITFRTDAAEGAIRKIVNECPGIVVGAGTVINSSLAEKAVRAGASFIVSAGLNIETVKWCISNGIPVVPGIATPSEIELGLSLGLDVLKFFPAETLGGVSMLKALSGPFPKVKFIATGGIDMTNIQSYAKAPNVLAIGGSWMVKAELINGEKWEEIATLAAEAREKFQGLEFAHVGINTPNESAAFEVASALKNFSMKDKNGNSSIFMNTEIEVVKKIYKGGNGHLAFRCFDVERTLRYLSEKGFQVDDETVSYDARGTIKSCYLRQEIGGFAIHLIKTM